MIPELQVILGTAMLATGLSYAWWVDLRVWMLRQDLFAIRDDLWDAMRARDLLDDPSHRAMRDALNAFIRVAPLFSIFTLLGIMTEVFRVGQVDDNRSDIPEVESARLRTVERVMKYLLFETLLGLATVAGLALICLLILKPFRIAKVAFSRSVTLVMDSTELLAMGTLVSQNRSGSTQQV